MEMVNIFVEVVNKTMNETLMQYEKIVSNILNSVEAIVRVRRLRIFENNLIGELAKILCYCFKGSRISQQGKLVWTAASNALEPILDLIGSTPEAYGSMRLFEPHVAIIIGSVLLEVFFPPVYDFRSGIVHQAKDFGIRNYIKPFSY